MKFKSFCTSEETIPSEYIAHRMRKTPTELGLFELSREHHSLTFCLGMVNCGLYFSSIIQWLNWSCYLTDMILYSTFTRSAFQQGLVRIRWDKVYSTTGKKWLVHNKFPIVVFASPYPPSLWSVLRVSQPNASKAFLFFLLLASSLKPGGEKCDGMLSLAIPDENSFFVVVLFWDRI